MSNIKMSHRQDPVGIRKNLQQLQTQVNDEYVPYSGAVDDVDLGSKDLDVTDVNATGNIDIDGTLTIDGLVTSNGDVDINGTLDVSGVASFGGQVNIDGDVDINANINVSGASVLQGQVNIDGDVDINANINVSGASVLQGQVTTNDIVINGSINLNPVLKTSTYALEDDDNAILASGTFTLTLPTSVGKNGQIHFIKNRGSGNVTVDGNGSETIDGALTKVLAQYEKMMLMSDNSNWQIMSD